MHIKERSIPYLFCIDYSLLEMIIFYVDLPYNSIYRVMDLDFFILSIGDDEIKELYPVIFSIS